MSNSIYSNVSFAFGRILKPYRRMLRWSWAAARGEQEQHKVLMSLKDAEQTALSWPNSCKAPNYLMNMHRWLN